MDLPTLLLPLPGPRLPRLAGLRGKWAPGPGSRLKVRASLLGPVHPSPVCGRKDGERELGAGPRLTSIHSNWKKKVGRFLEISGGFLHQFFTPLTSWGLGVVFPKDSRCRWGAVGEAGPKAGPSTLSLLLLAPGELGPPPGRQTI